MTDSEVASSDPSMSESAAVLHPRPEVAIAFATAVVLALSSGTRNPYLVAEAEAASEKSGATEYLKTCGDCGFLAESR